jgi:hypothetical protein
MYDYILYMSVTSSNVQAHRYSCMFNDIAIVLHSVTHLLNTALSSDIAVYCTSASELCIYGMLLIVYMTCLYSSLYSSATCQLSDSK